MSNEIQPILVIEHGPYDDVGAPTFVRATSPPGADWDISHIPNGTKLFPGEVVASLQQRIVELERQLAELPVIERIPDNEVLFGLCCQLEDPSDDEEHGWNSGVSWAQHWLVHTKKVSRVVS